MWSFDLLVAEVLLLHILRRWLLFPAEDAEAEEEDGDPEDADEKHGQEHVDLHDFYDFGLAARDIFRIEAFDDLFMAQVLHSYFLQLLRFHLFQDLLLYFLLDFLLWLDRLASLFLPVLLRLYADDHNRVGLAVDGWRLFACFRAGRDDERYLLILISVMVMAI